ncbi:hypothetical protein [Bradyrhizobium sp. CCGUVB23]|uniref:hypothetical protein n=1 Tax=Bradyrhizobium sp. CCGUVB23 TaxID=2949630 RepID=UPI0020B2421D|nr:hypothetical protein [Bradyrhizobium sp. CCGUVB23]MCP3462792.1 hypothetical protein [Bradyrhizobium sp. CCGUVB23]
MACVVTGLVRDELQFYATSARTDIAKELGFIGGKLPLLHGPAEGDEGLKKNIKIIEDMRNKVGDDFWLMYDCWMSLDLKARVRRARESGDPVEPTLSTGSFFLTEKHMQPARSESKSDAPVSDVAGTQDLGIFSPTR